MAFVRFLAMTPAEFREGAGEDSVAWMACHFSLWGTGLTNLPDTLPPGSLLMVDDRTPLRGHDPQTVARQLEQALEGCGCAGILLDFQRPGNGEAGAMASYLEKRLSCPVGVSSLYGQATKGPVCLPPPPCSVPLEAHLSSWAGREIWLELAGEGQTLLLTPRGAATGLFPGPPPMEGFQDGALNCHYRVRLTPEGARFILWRTREDLEGLEEKARALGVSRTLGLWQQWGQGISRNGP